MSPGRARGIRKPSERGQGGWIFSRARAHIGARARARHVLNERQRGLQWVFFDYELYSQFDRTLHRARARCNAGTAEPQRVSPPEPVASCRVSVLDPVLSASCISPTLRHDGQLPAHDLDSYLEIWREVVRRPVSGARTIGATNADHSALATRVPSRIAWCSFRGATQSPAMCNSST